jgi:sarcosine oxidase subunit gamma
MMLPTTSQLPIASPLANTLPHYKDMQEQPQTVGMAESTNWHHLHIRGMGAEAVLSDSYSMSQIAIGAVATVSDGILVRLRRDEFLLLTSDLNPAMKQLASKPGEALFTLTDITHGRAVICVGGVCAPEVLPKVCGLDFTDSEFPNRYAAQTSLAKVRALIVRLDTAQAPAYYLIVDRSLAAYVWEVVYDATQEFSGVVMSQELLRK